MSRVAYREALRAIKSLRPGQRTRELSGNCYVTHVDGAQEPYMVRCDLVFDHADAESAAERVQQITDWLTASRPSDVV